MTKRSSDQREDRRSDVSADERERGLTRRQMLAGISGAGVFGMVASKRTMALLSDTETSTKNSIGGSELDLRIAWSEYHNGENIESVGSCGSDGPNDYVDNDSAVLRFDEVEPGDSGSIAACVSPLDSAASLWARLTLVDSSENGITKMEAQAGDETPDRGELQDAFVIAIHEQKDCTQPNDTTSPLASGVVSDVVAGPLGEGIQLESRCLSLSWELPDDVPPTVLSDSISFALEFTAVQSRHSAIQSNPWGEP